MRPIDADALRKESKMLYSIHAFEPVEAYTQDQIDNAPTVYAALVKCGDCIHNDQNDCPFVEDDGNGIYTPLEIKYCGMGERKDGEK